MRAWISSGVSPSTSMTLIRDCAPETSVMRDGGTPSAFATSRIIASFAPPSAGGGAARAAREGGGGGAAARRQPDVDARGHGAAGRHMLWMSGTIVRFCERNWY